VLAIVGTVKGTKPPINESGLETERELEREIKDDATPAVMSGTEHRSERAMVLTIGSCGAVQNLLTQSCVHKRGVDLQLPCFSARRPTSTRSGGWTADVVSLITWKRSRSPSQTILAGAGVAKNLSAAIRIANAPSEIHRYFPAK
jgi:hypothetical protein